MTRREGEPLPHIYQPLRWWRDDAGRWHCEEDADPISPAYVTEYHDEALANGTTVKVPAIVRRTVTGVPGPKPGTTTISLDDAEREILAALEQARADTGRTRPTKEAIGNAYQRLYFSRSTFRRRWDALKAAGRLPANY